MKSKAAIKLIILFLFLNVYNFAFSQESEPSNYNSLKGELKVEKYVFNKDEDIWVHFLIKAEETVVDPVELKISEKFYYNFSFLIKSVENRMVSVKDDILSKKRMAKNQVGSQANNFKIVKLSKNQIYGEKINLSNYYNFNNKTGLFIIQGRFTPVPIDKWESDVISSKVIQIEIRDNAGADNNGSANTGYNTENNDFKLPATPYETVSDMLKAWKAKNWQYYYQYMDLEDLIKQYPKMYERYMDLRPSRRGPILSDFKEYLKKEYSKEDIREFDHVIYKSVVENERNQARIYVKVKYKGDLRFYKKYVYNLKRVQGVWKIYRWQYENYP